MADCFLASSYVLGDRNWQGREDRARLVVNEMRWAVLGPYRQVLPGASQVI